MKNIHRKISFLAVVVISCLFNIESKGAKTKDVTSRVNKIRVAFKEDIEKGKMTVTANEFLSKDLSEWVNWGNWGNWNNWNNWRDWNNWGNWGNWGNY